MKAYNKGELEQAAKYWQRVVEREPNFSNGIVQKRLDEVLETLRPRRLKRLENTANQAHMKGDWTEEIGAWNAYLRLEENDTTQANKRLQIAQKNLEHQWHYDNAVEFVEQGEREATIDELKLLHEVAPLYGDPKGIYEKLALSHPLNVLQQAEFEQNQRSLKLFRQEKSHRVKYGIFAVCCHSVNVIVLFFLITPLDSPSLSIKATFSGVLTFYLFFTTSVFLFSDISNKHLRRVYIFCGAVHLLAFITYFFVWMVYLSHSMQDTSWAWLFGGPPELDLHEIDGIVRLLSPTILLLSSGILFLELIFRASSYLYFLAANPITSSK